jgi:hypothetical protein
MDLSLSLSVQVGSGGWGDDLDEIDRRWSLGWSSPSSDLISSVLVRIVVDVFYFSSSRLHRKGSV